MEKTSNNRQFDSLKDDINSPYEIFILILGIISLIGLIFLLAPRISLPESTQKIASRIDIIISLIFLADFFNNLYRARNRIAYLKWGWLDFLAGIPGVPILRLARLHRIRRAVLALRQTGSKEVRHEIRQRPAQSTFFAIALMAILVLAIGSFLVVEIEQRNPAANILTADEAVWWAIVTVATVGYGDYFPVTNTGKIVSVVMMVVGVGLFGVLTSYLASLFITIDREEDDELTTIKAELAEIKRLLQDQNQTKEDEDGPKQK